MPRSSRPPHRAVAARAAGAALAIALTATPALLAAQRADALPVGARVRAEVRSGGTAEYVTGTLVAASADSVAIRPDGGTGGEGGAPRTLARHAVDRLQVSTGTRTGGQAFARGAGRGALVGLLIGGAFVGYAVVDERRNPCNDCMINGPAAATILSIGLTGVTTLVGGAIGAAHREGWRTIAVAPRP